MAYENPILGVSLEAETDLSDKHYHAVKVSSPFKCDIAADATEAIGVVVTNPRKGLAANVAYAGTVKIAVASAATVTAGKGVAITNGQASGNGDFGVALETVTGPGLATILLGVAHPAAKAGT